MDETPFGLRVKVALDYDEAVERTTTAFKEEGFGVLTTIDVKQTLKQNRWRQSLSEILVRM